LSHVSLTIHEIGNRLVRHGWLKDTTKLMAHGLAGIKDVLKKYQKFHGLEDHGEACPATMESLVAQRCCKHPDIMAEVAPGADRWPIHDLKWALKKANWSLALLPIAQQACDFAFGQIASVCGLKFTQTENEAEAQILVDCGQIDGRFGVLGFTQLADGTMLQKIAKFDKDEDWVFSETPERFKIDAGRVFCHELAHSAGLAHLPAGNVMQPAYSYAIRTYQPGDIAEFQGRYGLPG
jgi:hypothetical protein